MAVAIIDRYIKDEIKPNSLTIREKYHFADATDASYFIKTIRNLDRRVVATSLEFKD